MAPSFSIALVVLEFPVASAIVLALKFLATILLLAILAVFLLVDIASLVAAGLFLLFLGIVFVVA